MQEIILNYTSPEALRVQIPKDNPLDLDFSAGEWNSPFQSPNLNFVETYLAEFKSVSRDYNPVKYIRDFWQTSGITAKLPVKIIDSGVDVVIGEVDIFNPDNYINKIKNDNTDVIKLAIAENRKTLENKLQGINISSFYEQQLKKADLNEVAAVLNTIPDYLAATILTITLVISTLESIKAAQALSKSIADASTTPLFGTGAIGAGVQVAIQIAIDAIILAAQVANIVLLANEIRKNLIGDQKYYNSVTLFQILNTLLSEVGYSLSSSILQGDYKNCSIIAVTDNSGTKNRGKASNNPIPNQSGLSFLLEVSEWFNASIKVNENNTVQFERKDAFFNEQNSEIVLPQLLNNGIQKLNLSELLGSMSIKYARNQTDANSIQIEKRTMVVLYKNLQNTAKQFEGEKTININYSRANRKNGLNTVEKIYKTLTAPIRLLGGNIQDINDRKGSLQVNDFNLATGIVFMREGTGVNASSEERLNPDYLYDNFHEVDSPKKSQYFIREELTEVPISLSDFKKLQYNNIALDGENNPITIQSNIRNSNGLHNITYRQRIPSNSLFRIPDSKIITFKLYPTD